MVACLYPNGITNEYNLLGGGPELCLRLRVNAVDLAHAKFVSTLCCEKVFSVQLCEPH
jgi:hypothetical protein